MENVYLHRVQNLCNTNLRRILLTKIKFLEDFVDKIKKVILCLTLRLLMSYIYGSPSKARNANFAS